MLSKYLNKKTILRTIGFFAFNIVLLIALFYILLLPILELLADFSSTKHLVEAESWIGIFVLSFTALCVITPFLGSIILHLIYPKIYTGKVLLGHLLFLIGIVISLFLYNQTSEYIGQINSIRKAQEIEAQDNEFISRFNNSIEVDIENITNTFQVEIGAKVSFQIIDDQLPEGQYLLDIKEINTLGSIQNNTFKAIVIFTNNIKTIQFETDNSDFIYDPKVIPYYPAIEFPNKIVLSYNPLQKEYKNNIYILSLSKVKGMYQDKSILFWTKEIDIEAK